MASPLGTAQVKRIELFWLDLHRVHAHRAAHGDESYRPVIVVRATCDVGVGWGECASLAAPTYRAEFTEASWLVLTRYLAPRLPGTSVPMGPVMAMSRSVRDALDGIVGYSMAKAALEMAVLDAVLRSAGRSLASSLDVAVSAVPAGAVVGLGDDLGRIRAEVDQALGDGFDRVKVKIAPGCDRLPLQMLRRSYPSLALQADANGAYRRGDAESLVTLDDLDLVCLEQPLPAMDLVGHVALARKLTTPLALDESVRSPHDVELAASLGAARVLCLKPACLGGIGGAVEAHDLARQHGFRLWCGGMLQTALGRAVDVAIAGLPGFDLPGDFGDVERPFVEDDPFGSVPIGGGAVTVHRAPGVGPPPEAGALERMATRHRSFSEDDGR